MESSDDPELLGETGYPTPQDISQDEEPQREEIQDQGHSNPKSEAGTKEDKNSVPRKHVRYQLRYVDQNNQLLHQTETTGLDDESPSDAADNIVFEIVTTFVSNQKFGNLTDTTRFNSIASPATRSMRIFSRAIAHALRSVVSYYPGQNLNGDIIEIKAPYAILAHYYDELVEYREGVRSRPVNESCPLDINADHELGVLFEFLEEHVMPFVREEQERNKRGVATFEGYWIALKPGVPMILGLASGETKSGVVETVTGGAFSTSNIPYELFIWNMQYDGQSVGPCSQPPITIAPWEGEVQADSQPLNLEVELRDDDTKKHIEDGRKYWNLIQKQCKYFSGKKTTFPFEKVDSLVMLDLDDYYESLPHTRPMLRDVNDRDWIVDCSCAICLERRAEQNRNKYALSEHLAPLATPKDWEPDESQLLLMPSFIHAFIFKTRAWAPLSVDGFENPIFEEKMIENLVMDPERLFMIKALAKSYARLNYEGQTLAEDAWSADFVKGKGNGLNFLLHGSPGTGKTCTAGRYAALINNPTPLTGLECIAAYCGRPLMALTTRDIGVTADEVESNLIRHFRRAKSWGAVLLIDEADVFLERRSTADLARNSLVAGFLRALEWYEGMLFLTTNRVGIFDDAFISRIHIQLHYKDFDDESRRKIWKTFRDKLDAERGHYMRVNVAAKEYLDGKDLKAVKWNGREIRNAFQTAVALAEYEGKKDEEGKILLTDTHLRSVVEMSRDFKDYLDNVHIGSEGKRAYRRRERLEE